MFVLPHLVATPNLSVLHADKGCAHTLTLCCPPQFMTSFSDHCVRLSLRVENMAVSYHISTDAAMCKSWMSHIDGIVPAVTVGTLRPLTATLTQLVATHDILVGHPQRSLC